LLEVMEEAQITVDGVTHPLEPPFLVVATQNPIEYEGTFPLPESQLDRFLFRLTLGYPTVDEEAQILDRPDAARATDTLSSVVSRSRVLELMTEVRNIHVADSVKRYMAEVAYATRKSPHIYLGLSPRGTLALHRASQAWAYLHNRSYVVPDDVLALAPRVVEHRLILARSSGVQSRDMVHEVFDEIIRNIPVPSVRS
jgi:MoxR-like ATPase